MNRLAVLACLLFTSIAFAHNEGPNATPTAPPTVIAKVKSMSLFHPPSSPDVTEIRIYNNGIIERSEIYRTTGEESVTVAKLSSEATYALSQKVNAVKPGRLVDPEPNMPSCMDAPSVTYSVFIGATEIEIAANYGCKPLKKDNADSNDFAVRQMLDAAATLGQLMIVQKTPQK